MEEGENLRTIAEVAIALVGFTGVVAVLGSRARGATLDVDPHPHFPQYYPRSATQCLGPTR